MNATDTFTVYVSKFVQGFIRKQDWIGELFRGHRCHHRQHIIKNDDHHTKFDETWNSCSQVMFPRPLIDGSKTVA